MADFEQGKTAEEFLKVVTRLHAQMLPNTHLFIMVGLPGGDFKVTKEWKVFGVNTMDVGEIPRLVEVYQKGEFSPWKSADEVLAEKRKLQ